MKALVCLLAVLIPAQTSIAQSQLPKVEVSQNCKKNPVYCKILKLKPGIDKGFAAKLSLYIARYAKEFKFDPALSVAIAMQESSLENRNRMGKILRHGKLIEGVTDVGVFQIHVDTIANFNIDFVRLETDVEYQTYWHAKILSEKIRTCKAKREKLQVSQGNEWSCYHSFTYAKRKLYLGDVSRHLVKLVAHR